MKKCEVLGSAVLRIEKGSIVYVNEKQYELARKLLKPVDEDKKAKPVEETPVVEVRTEEAKEKRSRKKS